MIDETLKKRLITSSVFIAVAVGTIFWSPDWFFFMVIQAFSLVALNEYLSLAEKKGAGTHRILSLFFGALIPFAVLKSAELLVLGAAAFAMLAADFKKENREKALLSTALGVFGLLYIPCLFSSLLKIRQLDQGSALIFYPLGVGSQMLLFSLCLFNFSFSLVPEE